MLGSPAKAELKDRGARLRIPFGALQSSIGEVLEHILLP